MNITYRISHIIIFLLCIVVIIEILTGKAVHNENKYLSKKPFDIVPGDIPNQGIMFVDHKKNGRSGHGHSAITECKNNDILAFYANTDANVWDGHSVAGWSEYKRSTDGGNTWSNPIILDYSKTSYESDEIFSALVFGAITAPNGTIVLIILRFKNEKWYLHSPPVYLLSYDNGHTWSEAKEFDKSATLEDIGFTRNHIFEHDGNLFIVFHAGIRGPYPYPGRYSLWTSNNNGESWKERSELPFSYYNFYGTGAVLDNGDFIAYSYPQIGPGDEYNIPYVISQDNGYTWSEVKFTYFAKRIRNPQMSAKIGNYYFLHGRSGQEGKGSQNFVLYTSKDGITWCDGMFLMSRSNTPGSNDAYSANEIIGKYNSCGSKRLLIQSSIAYSGRKVNIRHWWLENIDGT